MTIASPRQTSKPRQSLAKMSQGDLSDLTALYSDSEVTRRLFEKELSSEAAAELAQSVLTDALAQEDQIGLSPYVARGEETGEFLGYCGLFSKAGDAQTLELSFAFQRDAWGQGFATEAADYVLAEALDRTEFSKIEAFVPLFNEPSRRLLEKVGFSYRGPRDREGLEVAYFVKTDRT